MSTVTICRGLPASGKTTWARAQVDIALGDLNKMSPPTAKKVVRVNRDDIRAMLHNSVYVPGVTEDVVIAVRDAAIVAAVKKGWDVIVDDTNLKAAGVRDLMQVAHRAGAEVEFKDFTDVPLNECLARDLTRGADRVGAGVIRDFHNRYLKGKTLPLPVPELKEEPKFTPVERGNIPAIIVDLDGTVAHNDGHRSFYDYTRVSDDKPKKDVIETVIAMVHFGYAPIFVSGREESCREDTAQWIVDHILTGQKTRMELTQDLFGGDLIGGLCDSNDNQDGLHTRLYMRTEGDYRDDAVVKYELYVQYIAPTFDVAVVLDDRNRVVRMWRQVGLTCLQVEDGDF